MVAQLRDDVDRAAAAAARARASNPHTVQAAESRASYLESVRQRNEQISQYLSSDQVEEAQANARAAREERQAAAGEQCKVVAPIAQLDAVRVGDQLTIVPEEPVGGEYLATVKVVDRVFDAASGAFGMRLELPNPGNRLPAGLRCRIEFKTASRPT